MARVRRPVKYQRRPRQRGTRYCCSGLPFAGRANLHTEFFGELGHAGVERFLYAYRDLRCAPAAFGGKLKVPWRPTRVIWRFTAASTLRIPASRKPRWRLVAMPRVAAGANAQVDEAFA